MMISVVIPLYNKQESISETLNSVINQTHRDFEVVIVDDGSTDNSMSVVKDFELIDSRIRVIAKDNGGVSSARNLGVVCAKYDYIAFLDADDLWNENYLEEQVKLIKEFPLAGMWGAAWGHIKDGIVVEKDFCISEDFRGYVVDYWAKNLYLYWTSAIVVNKKAFNSVGGFDERINYGEDLDVWYQIILNFPIVFFNRVLAYYQLDAENRAMNKLIPIRNYLPYYIDKYSEYRKNNNEFRRYFDKECLGRLFPMAVSGVERLEVNRILSRIDFNEFKYSMRFRFKHPKLYQRYLNYKNKKKYQ